MKLNLKLFPKTFLYTSLIMGIIVILVHSLIYFMLPGFYMTQKQEETRLKAEELSAILQKVNKKVALDVTQQYAIQHNVNIVLKTATETYRYHGFTPIDIYIDPEMADAFDSEKGYDGSLEVSVPDSLSSSKIILERVEFINQTGENYQLQMILDVQPVDEAKQVVFKILPYSIVISLLISLLAAYIYSKLITKPVKNILSVIQDMENLKKDSYCKVTSKDEIGMLSESINSLYATLWQTIDSLEQKVEDISKVEMEKVEFLRSASHELKTPLTTLSILLENMTYNIGKYEDRDYYLKQASKTVNQSTKMIQEILSTSNLQTTPLVDSNQLVDVNIVLNDVVESYKILAQAKKIRLNIDLKEECLYEVNELALNKVFSNIVSNAIQ